jgi:transcriptional regulator with XRE-family HTH domain
MAIAEKIKMARKYQKLSDVVVAERAGLSIYEYGDIEAYDNEAETVLDLKRLKKLCKVLEINLFDLFSLEKPQSCYLNHDLEKRNSIIYKRRNELGLTQDELGDKVGFYGFIIQEMESDGEFLESWCLEDIVTLAKILDIPTWVLIGT